jgi:Zn-dependent protease
MQPDLALTIFTVLVLIYSVIVHEVAHGYAANALGDPTAKYAKRLTLNPIRHVDLWGTIIVPGILVLTHSPFMFGWAKPVPYNPFNLKNQRWGESIVAVAGVATNFFMAIVFALITRYTAAHGMDVYAQLASIVVLVNLFLGFFNLIPVPPLDGYTFLRGLLPVKTAMGFREFEDRMRQGGFLTLLVFLLVFSYFLAGPFDLLVTWIFTLLVGA